MSVLLKAPRWKYGLRKGIRWSEYLVAALLTFAIAGAIFRGLLAVSGLSDPPGVYEYNDPAIYDWSSEADFLEFLNRSPHPATPRERAEQLAAYRYHHSWRRVFDGLVQTLWFASAVVAGILLTHWVAKRYMRSRTRMRLERWLL